ncbi:ribosomal protein S18-alanine N-acetyltransferase [Solemya velesiana gill symbiont]|uniref:[Ribosomal protein bS18]-alanine N-acetyltransferase n=1 Tax=Solemya velesiana gill symbiont TaxID=1918948 RepID=A0A1T2KRE6_9GAMM|nr:ribosomal protein S18-alanine N-acetyltransferase [Solemya velesiana gill symbiont]OOZ35371.1 ribosomal-protein-alanine N-acetyltransferase [Solemya velesiana gill symbiont]
MSAILKDPLLQIRPMRTADVEAVMVVEQAAYDFPWTAGIFRDCLRVGYCCWVVALDQRIIGYAIMSVAAGEAHILNVCIHPEMQGHGLGRRLMQRFITLARERSADTIFLEVRDSNKAAIHLYDTLGFNEVGRRRGYYPAAGGREDAIVLAFSLC